MSTAKLNSIWERRLAQWLPDEGMTRRTNLTWLAPADTAGAGGRVGGRRAGAIEPYRQPLASAGRRAFEPVP